MYSMLGKAQSTDSTSSSGLRYPLENKFSYPFSTSKSYSPLLMPQPSNVEQNVVYDPKTNTYIFNEKIGDIDYRPPSSMSFEEYNQYQTQQSKQQYWEKKTKEESGAGPSFLKGLRLGNQTIDKVFGSEGITITPQGSAELIFGYSFRTNLNPNIPINNQKTGSFIFKEKIMMNVTGAIGDKMEVGLNYNTEATFDFENKTKLEYSGKEDEIIKKIEAGDVSFGLPGTLISGSQSLFGLKTELQFGKLTVSNVFSHQRSESSSINVEGGAQETEFEVDIDQYDVNRHFFLSHFFRDNYDNWLKNLPHIESQMRIEEIEIWVVNKQNDFTNSRDIVGVMDLGEGFNPYGQPNFQADPQTIFPKRDYNQPADNDLNNLYGNLAANSNIRALSTVDVGFSQASSGGRYMFSRGRDYLSLESARLLTPREYTVNYELGYVSLNSPLRNDEVLAVAFVYTYKGKRYTIGELSRSLNTPNALIVKLIKGITQTPSYATWDLMMKNIYSIGAYQVSPDNFELNVLYRNDETGVYTNYLTGSKADFYKGDSEIKDSTVFEVPLVKVMELDNLDTRREPYSDGMFDFVEGITINSRNGRIIFPVLEPFGNHLKKRITGGGNNPAHLRSARKYVFQELYDSTQTKAQQIAEKNKFVLKGRYRSSSSSDIQLNAMNVPRGSVKVLAGGRELTENVDYTVDYTLGRVKILNQGLVESGTPIQIKLESNSFFNMQTKTLLGTHLDYKFSEDFNIGGTLLRLTERPLTVKVDIGDEPISNTIWGLNTSYRTESQLLTTLIDKLPFIETKEPSSIAIDAEFAQLIPGQSKDISKRGPDKEVGRNGVAFIDDFEGAQTKIELKTFSKWNLASPPSSSGNTFNYSNSEGLQSGWGRGGLSWYVIAPGFYRKTLPEVVDIDNIDIANPYTREINQQELFPDKDVEIVGYPTTLQILNLNFYPEERGPYNFNPGAVDNKMPIPEDSWAGIMREIVTSDFETSNIEFIEFWLMDPFLDTNITHSGGNMFIHLGEISEDILKDSRKAYENGLPTDETPINVDSTIWGFVPQGKSLVEAFDNNAESRKYQDVGLDGINDDVERDYHPLFQELEDPAADNFKHFIKAFEGISEPSIIKRYRYFNGMENNTPVPGNGDYPAQNKATPDQEDINSDNTLNTSESYYQYYVSMRPQDLEVGKNYIIDSRTTESDKPTKWYLFRIPVDDFESKYGQIEDFKSIRFMRLMLNGFNKDVKLRFATLNLVRGDWRRYKQDLYNSSPTVTNQHDETVFEVSSVNVEENSKKSPVNYVLPPGVTREQDASQLQAQRLNEQSLLLKVRELEDNDARAVFKNVQLDLRQYKNLKMFIHAEALPGEEDQLGDNEVTAIIRLGSDYQNNYYELEVPLKKTEHNAINEGNEFNREVVWPVENNIELVLQQFVNLKLERNEAIRKNPFINAQNIYSKLIEKPGNSEIYNVLKVKGNPNLSNIRQIMIGVRNPGDDGGNISNDGKPKSAEIWVNELRLTDFDNKGGWAANAQVQAKLADLGVVSLAGARSTPGFGSIEQTLEQRQKEEINQIDFSTNLELGKFFPEKANVSIPLFVGYSNSTINPEYYPKDPDVKLKDALAMAKSDEERKEIKDESRDVTTRKSFNLTNVRWNKQFKKAKLVSPSNLSATVAYSETNQQSYTLDYSKHRKYGASLNYVYNNTPKPVTPLNKVKFLRKPAFRIIRDFNFNYKPSAFTFSTKFDRDYQSMKLRDVYDDVDMIIQPTTSKGFYWDRNYTLRWDFTRALKFNYSASNRAIIDEPLGTTDWFEDNNRLWKDSVKVNILSGGRNLQFNQKAGLSYSLPLNKIPILNWTNIKAQYDATYSWTRGPLILGAQESLGNDLKNSNTMKLTGNFNMKNLYNKIGYFKRLDAKYNRRGNKSEADKRYKTVEFTKRTFFKKDTPKGISHKLGTENIDVTVTDENGNDIEVIMTIESDNKITLETSEEYKKANVLVVGKIEKGENPFVFVAENSIRMLLGFKNVNVSISRTGSTMLPGYLPETNLIGIDMADFYGAPGLPFAFGWQDEDVLYKAHNNNWMTQNESFSQPTRFADNITLNYRSTFEPFNGLRIDFSGMRNHSQTTTQDYYNYLANPFGNKFQGGSFSISTITIASAFEEINKENNWVSPVFERFRQNREVISHRLSSKKAAEFPEYFRSLNQKTAPKYADGFGPNSSEVLMYSFLSAYTGQNPETMPLEMFSWIALPNWKITFDGLSKISLVQKFLKTLTISHSYKSTYSVNSYATDRFFFAQEGEPVDLQGLFRDQQDNFILRHQPGGISINEQLSPLISFDMTWHNSLLTKIELRRTRMLALSMTNDQLTDTRNKDFVIGAGYRFKDVPLNISTASGGAKTITSDLNVRFDLSFRDNITVLRSVSRATQDQATTGAKKIVMGLTADYILSPKVNIQFYIDRNRNIPHVSNYYENAETNFGFSLRMSL